MQLVQESMSDPRGDVSPVICDTARVPVLSPVLRPEGGLVFLLRSQNEKDSWGGLGNYCFVPGLAAMSGLLRLLLSMMCENEFSADAERVASAAKRGLYFPASSL